MTRSSTKRYSKKSSCSKREKVEEYRYTAKVYDRLLGPLVKPIRRRVLSLVKKYKYTSILDVCCGTGDQLKLLKSHGFEGEGVDLSDAMLEVSKTGKHRADCIKQDVTRMHYEDDKFDLAMTFVFLFPYFTVFSLLLLFSIYGFGFRHRKKFLPHHQEERGRKNCM